MSYSEHITKFGDMALSKNVDDETRMIFLAGEDRLNTSIARILKPFDKIATEDSLFSRMHEKNPVNGKVSIFSESIYRIGNEIVDDLSMLKEHQMLLFHATTTELFRNFGHFPTNNYNYGMSSVQSNKILFNLLFKMSYLLDFAMEIVSELSSKEKEESNADIKDLPLIDSKPKEGLDLENLEEEIKEMNEAVESEK